MPLKFIGTKKRENWDREADRELQRREKVIERATAEETKEGNVPKKLNGGAR